MSIHRSSPAGSVPASFKTPSARYGRRSRSRPGAAYAKAATYGEQIRAELAAANPALLMLDREFETQSNDPVFLEPESGLAWYDTGAKNLELVLGVQSPYENAEALAYMLGNARAPFKPAHIKSLFAYMGGGFGGRDHTPLPVLCRAGGALPARPSGAAGA